MTPSTGQGGRSRADEHEQAKAGTTAPGRQGPPVYGRRSGQPATVKNGLTPNRRRRSVENDEYASFIRRVLRAYTRRVAAGDIDALADMTGLAAELDEAISQAVAGLREASYSWTEIAARLGVTRQAAQQRWGRSQGEGARLPCH